MEIKKGLISAVKDTFSVEVGLTKIDANKRIVSGFATLDNVDLQGDVVEFDASVKAFERSKRNVREMHQPIAVGKIVSYEPKTYHDSETDTVYKGVYVSAYVSTGAESTWQKVLDGTLSAFSIKGPIRESVMEMRKGSDGPVRIIKDYDLEELSLVDAGGNQLANVISIQKSASGDLEASGLAVDTEIDNIFWCESDSVSTMSKNETETCPDGHDMVQIGWIETGDPDSVQKMKDIITKHCHASNRIAEGGVSMADEIVKSEEQEVPADETVVQAVEATEVPAETEEAETAAVSEDAEVAPEGEEVSEAPDEAEDLEKVQKLVSDLEKKIESGLEASRSELAEAIDRIEKSISESREESVQKLNDFEQKYEEMKKSLEDISGKFETVSKSVEALDGASALKKSNDLGGSEGTDAPRVGLWNGAIL